MNIKRGLAACFLVGLLALPGIVGCGSKEDSGLKPQEQQMAGRLEEITKKTGGDWDKLTPEDREYMIKDVAQGSEQSARMLLSARAGKLKGTPGGAPGNRPGNAPGQ